MDTENKESCSQRDSAERKGYVRAHRSFNRIWKERDSAEPDILSKILDKDNLNRAYKRVKANKGAPGVDGMTIEAALPWRKEHNRELTERIRKGNIPRLLSGGWKSRSRTGGYENLASRPSWTASSNRQCSNSSCQSMSRCFRMTALATVRGEGQKTLFSG